MRHQGKKLLLKKNGKADLQIHVVERSTLRTNVQKKKRKQDAARRNNVNLVDSYNNSSHSI